MRYASVIVVLFLGIAGCSSPDSFVVATVTAPAGLPAVGRLRVAVSNGGTGVALDYPAVSRGQPVSFPATIGIKFSRSRAGTVDLVVDAVGRPGGEILASGAARTSVVVGGTQHVDIPLTAGAPLCGNGMVDPGEECDDHNRVSGDGCDFRCKSERGTDGGLAETPPESPPDLDRADGVDASELPLEGSDGPGSEPDAVAEQKEPSVDASLDTLPEVPTDVVDAPIDIPVETPIDSPTDLPLDAPVEPPLPDVPAEPPPPDAPDELPVDTVDAPASEGGDGSDAGACGAGGTLPTCACGNLTGHTKRVLEVSIAHDVATIVSGSDDHSVKLWRVSDHVNFSTLAVGPFVNAIDTSPDSKYLATGDSAGNLKLWKVVDGSFVKTVTTASGEVVGTAFSPTSTQLASATSDMKIGFWSVPAGAAGLVIATSFPQARTLSYSPMGTIVVIGYSAMVASFKTTDGSFAGAFSIAGIGGSPTSTAFSPDGTLLAGASTSDKIRIWRVSDAGVVQTISEASIPNSVSFSPDGTMIAAGNSGGQVNIWRVSDGMNLATLTGSAAAVNGVSWSSAGSLLAGASDDHNVYLWCKP